MSLQVLVAHTGDRLPTNPASFASIDAFKSWLADTASIPPSYQIILTASGKQAKLQALAVETEVFLYDRRLVSTSSSSSAAKPSVPIAPSLPIIAPSQAPDSITDQNDRRAWQDLFKARRSWALDIAGHARTTAQDALGYLDAVDVIDRALAVAMGNLESHTLSLRSHFDEARQWSEQTVLEQREVLSAFELSAGALDSLPVDERFLRFIPALNVGIATRLKEEATFGRSIDQSRIADASHVITNALIALADDTTELGARVQQIMADADTLNSVVKGPQSSSVATFSKEVSQLLEEIDVVAGKVDSDCDHVLSLPDMPQSIPQISKMALLHTRNYLPSLREYCIEMEDLAKSITAKRNDCATQSVQNMHKLATIESNYAQTNAKVQSLDFPANTSDAFDFVVLVSQLPLLYGSLLLEAIWRSEWAARIRNESAILAEDIAGYREEEQRRRKKWLKNVSDFVDENAVNGNILDFELNLEPEEKEWPEISRDIVEQYLNALRASRQHQDVLEKLSVDFRALDKPTRRQTKTANNFKNGSIHEASSGKASFLLHEQPELRALREANTRLDEDLKGQKSRVRKLEDLLYRHGQTARTASGNVFQVTDLSGIERPTIDSRPSSPRSTDPSLRRLSEATRRSSANRTSEDRSFAQRIVTLEAELHQERHCRQEVERHVDRLKEGEKQLQRNFEETESTKHDLMDNLEAQQREFTSERRLLENELEKHKLKGEELEDELDRLLGSRETIRVEAEGRVRQLEIELERQEQTNEDLRGEMRQRDEVQEEHTKILHSIHDNLAPGQKIPESIADLVNSLDEVVGQAVRRAQELAQNIASTRSEKDNLKSLLGRQEKAAADAQIKIISMEDSITTLQQEVASESARATSLTVELDDGRKQLRTLRAKFADGETGSEALRQRVEEEASRAGNLATQLAESKSHVNSLDVELSSLQRKQKALLASHGELSTLSEQRAVKASQLTSRLIDQNHEMTRLAEGLGLAIIWQDNGIVVQRNSKLTSASTTGLYESTSLASGSTTIQVTGQKFDVTPDASLVHWMHPDSGHDEDTQFARFLSKHDELNLNVLGEAIIKLRRDFERTGKKWKIEARAYRDKYIRVQSDAHEKIAFRSFKEGDLALFLPTRNQATRPWAAFNVGAPHYFLREQDSHKLRNREWLVARISRIEERVVNLSKTMSDSLRGDSKSIGATSDGGASYEDDNPFELSDGLRWYLLDAAEEKSGAPSTPGLGKSTVASANVDAVGSIRMKKSSASKDASKTLNKSLESRRSSSNSKRGSISGPSVTVASPNTPLLGVDDATLTTNGRPGSGSSANHVTSHGLAGQETPTVLEESIKPKDVTLVSSSISNAGSSRAETRKKGAWNSLWAFDVNMEEGPKS